jgi:hypothetical protein
MGTEAKCVSRASGGIVSFMSGVAILEAIEATRSETMRMGGGDKNLFGNKQPSYTLAYLIVNEMRPVVPESREVNRFDEISADALLWRA